MMIYCSHKYGGLEENKRICEAKVKALQLADLENTYVSPIHALGFMYDVVSYEQGMELCIDLLSVCDKMVVISEASKGVKIEIEQAEKMGIPIEYYAEVSG